MVRHFLLGIVMLIGVAIGHAAGGTPSFTGVWEMKPDGGRTFSLNLTQTNNSITGYHDAVAQNGNRIDEMSPKDGPPSIVGTIDHGVAHVTIVRAAGEGTGEATITMKGGSLEWKITKSTGIYYIPPKAVLFRVKAQ